MPTPTTTMPPQTDANETAEATALALLPVPAPAAAVDPHEQAVQFQNLIAAAHRMKRVGFGAHGSIMGVTERVDYAHLWLNPASPVVYRDEDIREMARSLGTQQQLHPLIVTPWADPRQRGAQGGGTGADLLIIDGGLRFLAAPRAGIDALNVIVRPLPSFYAVMLETVTAKVSQRPLTDLEAGRFCRRLMTVHRVLSEQEGSADVGARSSLPELRQEDLAALLGRSQATISRWVGLADLSPGIQADLDAGRLTPAQAREFLSLPATEQNALAAQVAAENARRGTPLPRHEVRSQVQTRTNRAQYAAPPNLAPASGAVFEVPRDIFLPQLGEEQPPVAVAILIHDLTLWLTAIAEMQGADGVPLDPAVAQLARALAHPRIQALIREVAPSPLRS